MDPMPVIGFKTYHRRYTVDKISARFPTEIPAPSGSVPAKSAIYDRLDTAASMHYIAIRAKPAVLQTATDGSN